MYEDLIERLLKRAEIRRQISTRKSVQEGKPDRIADLLEEAALALENSIPIGYDPTEDAIKIIMENHIARNSEQNESNT